MKFSILLSSYFFIALFSGYLLDQEFFPIFNGRWFHKTPVVMNDYGVKLKIEKSESSVEEIYYELATQINHNSWRFAAYNIIQKWGQALESNIHQDAQKYQKIFFNQHLNRKIQAIALYKRTYDSVDFIKTHSVLKELKLDDFHR